jgi:hypothetical protein
MQLPMIGTMEIDHGKFKLKKKINFFIFHFGFVVYENGNHSTYHDDDECDSSSHPRKVSLDEDILPTTTTVDEDDDEPGMNKKIRENSIYNEY